MIDPKQIPDEVVEAAAQAFRKAMHDHWGWPMLPWHEVLADDQEYWRKLARASFPAGLAAWPETRHRGWDDVRRCPCLILPLPKEPRT